jgi:hypothetical protein
MNDLLNSSTLWTAAEEFQLVVGSYRNHFLGGFFLERCERGALVGFSMLPRRIQMVSAVDARDEQGEVSGARGGEARQRTILSRRWRRRRRRWLYHTGPER